MTKYIIIVAIALILLAIIRAMMKITKISNEATMLVAFIKEARQKKSSIFDRDKTQEEFDKEKFEKLLMACFLWHRLIPKISGLRETYRFNIRENGPVYGKIIEVKVRPFIKTITNTIQEIKLSLPQQYHGQIDDYLENPFSEKSLEISSDIKEKLFSNDKYLKNLSDNIRNGIIDQDYMYILCGNCK